MADVRPALLVVATLAVSCAWTPLWPRAIGNCGGALVTTQRLPFEGTLRHRLEVVGEGVDFPLQSVLQLRRDELVFVGFNALGAKLFTIVQRGDDVDVDALPAAALPIDPRNLLRDIERVEFGDPLEVNGVIETAPDAFRVTRPACGYELEVERLERRAGVP